MEPMKSNSKKLLLNVLKGEMKDNDPVDAQNWKLPVKKNDSLTHFSQNFNVLHLGPSSTNDFTDSDSLTLKIEDSEELTNIKVTSKAHPSCSNKKDSESFNVSSADTVIIDPSESFPSTSNFNSEGFDFDNDDTMIIDHNDNQSSCKPKRLEIEKKTSFEIGKWKNLDLEVDRLERLFYSSSIGREGAKDLLSDENLPKLDMDKLRKSLKNAKKSKTFDFAALNEICKQGLVHSNMDSKEGLKWIKLLPDTKRGIKLRFVNSMVNTSTSEAEISNDVDRSSTSASSTSSSGWTNGVKMTDTVEEEEEFPPSPESEPSRKKRKRTTTTPKKSPEVQTCPLCARNMKLKTLLKHIENCNGGVVTRSVVKNDCLISNTYY